MEALTLPDNIKVHYAGAEVMNQYMAFNTLGVRYSLYTAFPFVERMIFDKYSSPLMPLDFQKKRPNRFNSQIYNIDIQAYHSG